LRKLLADCGKNLQLPFMNWIIMKILAAKIEKKYYADQNYLLSVSM
jgi:hypothetical protein